MDEVIDEILSTYGVITVVGASGNPRKAANHVPAHLQAHGWRIVPVNPRGGTILGEPAYPTLAEVPEPVGLVNVFRPSVETAEVTRQAAAVGAKAVWLQLGITSEEARQVAEAAGMLFVQDHCMLVEQRLRGWNAPGQP